MIPELLALLVCTIVGVVFVRRPGEALLLGIAVGAGVLLALSLVGVEWSRTAWGIGMAVMAVGARWVPLPRSPEPVPSVRSDESRWLPLPLLALASILVLGYAILATLAPIWDFDFIADWGLKGRTYFEARGVDWHFLEHPLHRGIHPDYPPLLTLAYDIFAIARGAWNDQTLGLLSVAFGVGLLLVVHRMALEESGSRTVAAFLAAAMVPLACSPWIGMAEGPLVAYGTTALLLIRRERVMLGAVMLGLAASTKNEGLTLILAAAVGLAAARRVRDVARLWPAIAIPLPWLILRHLHHLRTDLTEGNFVARVIEHLAHPRPLLDAFAANNAGRPLFWLALAIGVALTIRPLLARERFVLVAIAVQLVFYLGAYLATPNDVAWHVHWSLERLLSHLAPALTYVVLVRLLPELTRSEGDV